MEKVTIGVFENNLLAYQCYRGVGFKEAVVEEYDTEEINGEKWKVIELEIGKQEIRTI